MQRKMFDLSEKRALIVGGAGEIGLSIAEAFLEYGAKVVVVDKDKETVSKIRSLNSKFSEAYGLEIDINNREEINNSIHKSRNLLNGSIEILVNAAGIQKRKSSEEFSADDWDEVLSVNLTSVFLYSKLVSKEMISNGYGKIINVASIMSQFGGINIPAYSASKGGVAQLTKAMSNDLASKGLRINAISPGYIDTKMNAAIYKDKERNSRIISRTPLGRWGKPDDLKGISVFLASEASDFITGTVIPVDGGYSSM